MFEFIIYDRVRSEKKEEEKHQTYGSSSAAINFKFDVVILNKK